MTGLNHGQFIVIWEGTLENKRKPMDGSSLPELFRDLTARGTLIGRAQCPTASGRTLMTSSCRNWSECMNTAKCPPPLTGTNALRGALMDSR